MTLMKKLWTAAALVAVLSLAPIGAALAQGGITLAEAERIALAEVPGGRVTDIERERERRGDVYEVTVLDERGLEHDLVIDAESGAVLSSRIDYD